MRSIVAVMSAASVCFAAAAMAAVHAGAQVQRVGHDPVLDGSGWGWGPDRLGGYATDRILVKLAPDAALEVRADGAVFVRTAAGGLDAVAAAELAAARPESATRALSIIPADGVRAAQIGLDRWMVVRVPTGTDTPALAQRVTAAAAPLGAIERAEVDGVGGVAADAPVPNDPLFGQQYALENTGQFVNGSAGTAGSDIRARAAWHLSIGSTQTIIAVLDSGVNPHEEFTGRLLPGWNVPLASNDTTDMCSSHGTHCAGIAAAAGDNGVGVAGLDWNARILPVSVVNPCGGLASWLGDGLIWATDHGARVMNMSLQYSVNSTYMHDAVIYAQGAGAILIAAAGNTGSGGVAYPARWDEVIAVGSIDMSDIPAATSAIGPEVDVAAPGVMVLGPIDLADYGYKSGTSMAAPQVSGTLALLRAANPSLNALQLRNFVEQTCHDVAAPGIDTQTGHGRIDAGAALRAARAAAGLGDLNGDGIIGGADLGIMLGAWGGCGVPCPADLNDDGVVDGADLGIVLGNWGGGS